MLGIVSQDRIALSTKRLEKHARKDSLSTSIDNRKANQPAPTAKAAGSKNNNNT
jgi:hypothetical protein